MDANPVQSAARFDSELRSIETLDERLHYMADFVAGPLTFSSSLGIEDQVIGHSISKTGVEVDVFTLDTGRHFPETLQTLAESERRFGYRIKVYAPDREDVESLVSRDGVFGFRESLEARKACCHVRKVRPLRRALKGAGGWITGLRSGQAESREDVLLAEWDEGHKLLKLAPLGDWSLEQIEAYAAAHDVPLNPLHAQGFASIGCEPCTRAILPGEDVRAGRWWWENPEHKECGLHNRPKTVGGAA